jgi:hypothetical protein
MKLAGTESSPGGTTEQTHRVWEVDSKPGARQPARGPATTVKS